MAQPSLDNHAHHDPLLACLLALTTLKQAPCSETSLIAGLPLVDQCLTPTLFVRAAERAQLDAKVVERDISDIAPLVLPAVLLLENNQAVILLESNSESQQAIILDAGRDEQQQLSWSQLEKRYTGFAIYVKNKVNFEHAGDMRLGSSSAHWFWSVIKSSWRIYRDVLLASLLINLFVVASPLFVMNVYDRVVPNQALETLWVLAIGVMVVIVFDVILKALRNYFIEVAGKKSDILLSAFLLERVLGARYAEKPGSIGAFVSQFREFDTVRNFYTASMISALVDLPFVLLFLLLIFYIGGTLVWVPAVTIPLVFIYGLLLRRPMRQAIEQTFAASAQKNASLVESLVGLETVKVLGAEGVIQRTWEAAVGHLSQWGQRMRMLSMSVSIFSNTLQQMASVVLIIVGVYLIVDRELTMGALIACFMLTGRALSPIAQVASLLVSYDQTQTALGALQHIVDKPQERNPDKPFVKRPSFTGEIQFNKVDFTYPDDQQAALNAVSFTIKAGERIGIIGRIGSGKSTIQKLLLGLYQPTRGSILFDGIDNQQIDPADLRRHIGYVPQDVVLFAGSIKDNISYGALHSDDQAMVRAAEIAGVTEFVNRHPLGFDRHVGERGQALSGGQRQSLGIARASLHKPAIYVFDEPTSGMDNSTETLIKENLAEHTAGKTVILVTHKTSLLSLIDRLIVLDRGNIIADGPKDAVLDALKRGQLHVSQP
ncbi:MAG: type I secretion system permease/ATPase [Cellvibrionaceae bacterium]|nr:type I secretion system permease/ATPase [Cellvibrionaceae bacterium]